MGSNGNRSGVAEATQASGTAEILRPRAEWIVNLKAEVARTGDTNVSQMHYARLGRTTE
jgi:phosphomethylpyrimidine synthase